MRQQLCDVAVHLSRQTREHVLQIRIGVVPIHAHRLNEAYDSRGPLAGAAPEGFIPIALHQPLTIIVAGHSCELARAGRERLRRALLREAGGDRVVAQVLMLVPAHGLEAVLVAAELALEAALPSGCVSLEHVINMMARLNAPARPTNVVTTLATSTPPLADTARYDQLREVSHA